MGATAKTAADLVSAADTLGRAHPGAFCLELVSFCCSCFSLLEIKGFGHCEIKCDVN